MACGIPAVAFDCGGIRDAVHHLKTGYLAKERDTEDFINGIKVLLEDDALEKRLGMAARQLMEQEFSEEKEISCFESLYKSLIS